MPLVLFSWTDDMEKWEEGSFQGDEYGKIVWETHVYYWPGSDTVDGLL